MAAPIHASTSNWEDSVDEGPHWHPYGDSDRRTSCASLPSIRSSTTLAEGAPSVASSSSSSSAPSSSFNADDDRPFLELKISRGGANILNAFVVDAADRPLYFISSDESRTVVLAERGGSRVAAIDWDRQSPRMVFRGRKVKCKEWLARAGPRTATRRFSHGDSHLKWLQKPDRGILVPTNRPGLPVATWRTEADTEGLRLQIFHVALVEPGLLEAILLSIVLLQSGRSLGDTLHPSTDPAPRFYSIGFAFHV